MPGAELVAVIAFTPLARGRAEVVEVAAGPTGVVLMVAGGRTGSLFVTPPRWVVAVGELPGGAIRICVVAGGKDRAGYLVEEPGGRFVAAGAAVSDITCPDQNRVRRVGRRRRGAKDLSTKRETEHDHRSKQHGVPFPCAWHRKMRATR